MRKAYTTIPRHIRNGVLIRQNIASHLCTAVGGQQFRKEWRKLLTRIMFERVVLHILLLFFLTLFSLRLRSLSYSAL